MPMNRKALIGGILILTLLPVSLAAAIVTPVFIGTRSTTATGTITFTTTAIHTVSGGTVLLIVNVHATTTTVSTTTYMSNVTSTTTTFIP